MHEVESESISLTVTSPPYYNAPFDYPDVYSDYEEEYLKMISRAVDEIYRVTAPGRIVCLVVDDMLVNGEKLPIVADITAIMRQSGFRYRDRIVWVKPKGYSRISRRSGVLIQHPYPMYFYPDNIQESILIFQKGRFDYRYLNYIDSETIERSKIDCKLFNEEEWNLTVWPITNVLPTNNVLEKGVAAFPEELASRLVRLFSFYGETVLDPFLGSGTTSKVCAALGRNSVGYELNFDLKEKIYSKIGGLTNAKVIFERREDSTHGLLRHQTSSPDSRPIARHSGGQSLR
jgi:DNA modification methylase